MISKILILCIFLFFLIIQATVIKSWGTPSDWYFLWSCVLILGAVFFAYRDYEWSLFGLFWWLLSCVVFQIGGRIGLKRPIKLTKKTRLLQVPNISINWILMAYFVLGLLYSVILLNTHGFSIAGIFNIAELYKINNFMQGYRYSNLDENEGVIQQICLAFTYGLPPCAGFLLPEKKDMKSKLLCIGSLAPNVLITIINNAKAGVIIAVILFMAGFMLRYIEINGRAPRIKGAMIRYIFLGGSVFIVFMFFAIRLRYNSDVVRASSHNVLGYLKAYIFGCTVNFDYYFFDKIRDWSIRGTFLPDSNILTANMFWIHSYGYLGTIILWFFGGVISGSAYSRLAKGKSSVLDKVILVYMYVNAIYFFTYMAFSYTTVIIGVFVLFPFFLLFFYKQKELGVSTYCVEGCTGLDNALLRRN